MDADVASVAEVEEIMGERNVWVLLLIQGVVAVVIGALLVARPGTTTIVLVQILGWYWLFTGFLSILMIAGDRTQWGLKLFVGLLGVLAGFVVVSSPLWATGAILAFTVIFLGIGGLINGLTEVYRAFKGAGWGQGLLGVFNFVIGALLLANVLVAAVILPWAYGMLGIAFGLAAIIMAFRVRKVTSVAVTA